MMKIFWLVRMSAVGVSRQVNFGLSEMARAPVDPEVEAFFKSLLSPEWVWEPDQAVVRRLPTAPSAP